MNTLNIYTDGSCLNNGSEFAVGGWAAVIESNKRQLRISSGCEQTTSNRMELTAVIEGLKAIKNDELDVVIHTDSAYVLNGCTSWLPNWKRNNWVGSNKKQIENLDLWKKLDQELQKRAVSFVKVKAHSGHPQNELVDRLANRAANGCAVRAYLKAGNYH